MITEEQEHFAESQYEMEKSEAIYEFQQREKNAQALLFLDDYRLPIECASYMYQRGVDCRIYHKEWVVVRSYGAFVEYINECGLPQFISFDHDLADVDELKEGLPFDQWFNSDANREYTGMDCAKFLVDYCMDNGLKLPEFAVHSANPAGYENIKGLLDNFSKHQKEKE